MLILFDIAPANFSVAGMRRQENIVKTANQPVLGLENTVAEYTKFLFKQRLFGDSKVMI